MSQGIFRSPAHPRTYLPSQENITEQSRPPSIITAIHRPAQPLGQALGLHSHHQPQTTAHSLEEHHQPATDENAGMATAVQQRQQQRPYQHLNGDAADGRPSTRRHRTPSARDGYTNGDYEQHHAWTQHHHPDDRISQPGTDSAASDNVHSRPASRGTSSGSAAHSRPATSHEDAGTTNQTSTAIVATRPESSGLDASVHPAMRHGFAEAYSSEEYLTMLEQVSFYLNLATHTRSFTCTSRLTDTKTPQHQLIPLDPSSTTGDPAKD
jgi:hypothetical protein